MVNNMSSNGRMTVLRHLNAFRICIYTLEIKSQILRHFPKAVFVWQINTLLRLGAHM